MKYDGGILKNLKKLKKIFWSPNNLATEFPEKYHRLNKYVHWYWYHDYNHTIIINIVSHSVILLLNILQIEK